MSGNRLSGAARLRLIHLYRDGLRVSDIADDVGCHPNTVSNVVRMFAPEILRVPKRPVAWKLRSRHLRMQCGDVHQ